ncbi:GTPase-activating protein gyp3-like isoform X1 [Vicia villosa]|uniref:GTPase-activating protein gyp3-like isoform X1 n=1 Tax=Vicia villosa TaxID=3911 RepID=UPI00273C73A4|nr:GTPase-activating protein gyp3-like isoform X1 [Vicia villosa]
MAETAFNLLHNFKSSRDSYGFALRPQYAQRYREYSLIYKEEEAERSDKWGSFIEQIDKSSQASSSEDKHKETLKVESSEVKEEKNPHRVSTGDESSSRNFSECAEVEETSAGRISEGETEIKEGDSSSRTSSGETETKEVTGLGKTSEGGDSSRRESFSDCSTRNNSPKELHHLKESKTRKVQRWAEIRPSLSTIEEILSCRVKKGKNMKGGEINGSDGHLPSIEKSEPVEGDSEEDSQGKVSTNETLDGGNGSRAENDLMDRNLPELFSPWKELESLVQGGVPKDLRGEVWQAFVGVNTRRVERYYDDLLAQETNSCEGKEQDVQSVASGKWRKQIEKDIPRTFPGHPALDENGRNSLRRLLLAYARHNPSVGYCQAMNFFAGLLLLLMPEENAFWTFVGIIDDYFEGYYTEEMIESQVDQLVFEELMRERFPKLGSYLSCLLSSIFLITVSESAWISFFYSINVFGAVNHLDYLGVQVAWVSGPWFLSIFVNMIPWESVIRVWDVLLFEGNRVMLFRTALALMELYGPALVTTKDAGDAITLLQSLVGSTFDSSQLVFTACMGFLAVTEARLQELRVKHRPSVLEVIEERSRKGRVWKDSKGIATKLYSFKNDPGSLVEEKKDNDKGDMVADKDVQLGLESHSSNLDELLNSLNIDSKMDSLPDLQEQVVLLKVEMCRLLEEKRSSILRAEELETALMEMVKEDNRLELTARVEQLEHEVAVLQQALTDKQEQEAAMLQVLIRLEQDQKVTEDARRRAEQDLAAHKLEVHVLQEKYEKATASIAEMEKRVVMAESMLEATLQYESGQSKAQSSPRAGRVENPSRKIGLLSFGLGWRDRNKGKHSTEESTESSHDNVTPRKESNTEEEQGR